MILDFSSCNSVEDVIKKIKEDNKDNEQKESNN